MRDYQAEAEHRGRAAVLGARRFSARHEPSAWVRTRLVDLLRRCAEGDFEPCQHLRAGTEATVVGPWQSGRVGCAACGPPPRLAAPQWRTCDRCQRPAEAVIHHEIVEAAPGLTVLFGFCPACHHAELVA